MNNQITKFELLFYSSILAVIKIIFGGYSFGKSDLTVHLIPIYRLLDGSFISNDFIANFSLTFGPTFYFSRIIAYIGQVFPLQYVFLIGVFLINLIIIWVTYFAVRDLFKTSDFSDAILSVTPNEIFFRLCFVYSI